MNNLRKFNTEADYSAATLNYPAVSWIVSGDTVKFDRTEPEPPQPIMVMIIPDFGSDAGGQFVMYNCDFETGITTYVTDITMDDTTIEGWDSSCEATATVNKPLIAYTLVDGSDTIEGWLSGGIGESEYGTDEMLIPAEITEINGLPTQLKTLVILATTPPTGQMQSSDMGFSSMYVPDEAVSAYESSELWGDKTILPLSEYSGNLPIN